MRKLITFYTAIFFVAAIQTVAIAQTPKVTETFKKHFNETVKKVQNTDNADEKRAILNASFNKMISAVDKIEKLAPLSVDEIEKLETYKLALNEKLSELNGLDGFGEVIDEDLDEFSNYSQDFLEQANRSITIGVTTALLILIILLLL